MTNKIVDTFKDKAILLEKNGKTIVLLENHFELKKCYKIKQTNIPL